MTILIKVEYSLQGVESRVETEVYIHAYDRVLEVAGNVKPGAWVNHFGVPALKNTVWIDQVGFPGKESISCPVYTV